MLARHRRRKKDSADRALRALGRAEPARIVAFVNAVAPGLVPKGRRITPAHVLDPHLDQAPRLREGDFAAQVGPRDLLHSEFQSYRDRLFPQRVFHYHLGYVERFPGLTVHTVAIWLYRPPASARRNQIEVGNVIVRITTIVLPEVPAALLLEDTVLACFAPGADPGELTVDELCRRAVKAMVRGGATRVQWRVAGVVAATQGRYKELVKAMREDSGEQEIIGLELIEYGEDIGYRRGRRRGLKQGLQRALLATYEARFGAAPRNVADAVEATNDTATLLRWQAEFSTRSARQIAAAVKAKLR